eukprot:759993-Prorocentrum_minimum.AAC.1
MEDHRRAEFDVKGVGRRYLEGNLHPLAMKLVRNTPWGVTLMSLASYGHALVGITLMPLACDGHAL